jgi:hypothetical protein
VIAEVVLDVTQGGSDFAERIRAIVKMFSSVFHVSLLRVE